MPPLSPDTLYSQISENLRASDDFSFKLLGLVPLSTLLTFVGLLLQKEIQWSPGFYALGLMGAMLIWCVFRWELRNIQRCLWFGHVLDKMEAEADCAIPAFKRYKKPRFLGLSMGKTESEKLVYTVLIIGWLVFPLLARNMANPQVEIQQTVWDKVYYLCAALVLLCTLITCSTNLRKQTENA